MTERELFVAALHLGEGARVAFLDLACDDRAVRSRVESLLLEHDRLGGFLEPSAASAKSLPIRAPRPICPANSWERSSRASTS